MKTILRSAIVAGVVVIGAFLLCGNSKTAPLDMQEYKGYPGYFNDYLDVFRWNGEFVARLVFDIPFSTFIVSQNEDVLYTSTIDTESLRSIIMKYQIPLFTDSVEEVI